MALPHLRRWTPDLNEDVTAGTPTPAYRKIARFAKAGCSSRRRERTRINSEQRKARKLSPITPPPAPRRPSQRTNAARLQLRKGADLRGVAV